MSCFIGQWLMNLVFCLKHISKASSLYYLGLSTGARITEELSGYPAASGKCSFCECFYFLRLSQFPTSSPSHQLGKARKTEDWNKTRSNELYLLVILAGRARKIIFDLALKIWDYMHVFLFVIYENTTLEALRGLKLHPLSIDSIKAQIWVQWMLAQGTSRDFHRPWRTFHLSLQRELEV